MSKGSQRRPGEGYEDGWSRIFEGKDVELHKAEQRAKNAKLRARLDAMPIARQIKCTEPFCQCEPGKCEQKDEKEDKE